MKALYYTLGNSDISIDKNQRFFNFKELTEQVYSFLDDSSDYDFRINGFFFKKEKEYKINYLKDGKPEIKEKKIETIEFPIFTTLIDKLQEQNRMPEKLFLFATNQTEISNQRQDTIFLAQILKKYCIIKLKIKNIQIIEINNNPSDFTAMLNYFEGFVKKEYSSIKLNLHNVVQLTAGTPQSYYALAQNIQNMPRVRYYYISRERNESIAYESSAFGKLNLQNYLEIIKGDIFQFNYSSALNVIRKSPFSHRSDIIYFIEVLSAKKNFIVNQSGLEKIGKIIENDDYFESLYKELYDWINKDAIAYFTEFYNQIKIALVNQNYIIAIAFIFSMLDNLRQILVEQLLNIKIIDGYSKDLGNKIKELITDTKKFDENNKRKLDPNKPSRPVLDWVITHFSNEGNKFATSYTLTKNKFDALQNIRNHGPFAHGYTGVDKILFEELYNANEHVLLHDIQKLLNDLKLFNQSFDYEAHNNKIIEMLKTEFKSIGKF